MEDRQIEVETGNEKQVIDLLLEEYRTLREETISRMSGRLQLLGVYDCGGWLGREL